MIHDIEWDDKKVSLLWDYYSKNPGFSDNYFTKNNGKQILTKSKLPLNKNLNVLDFGSGPGWMMKHLNNLKSNWKYTAVDFSEDSIAEVNKTAKDNNNFCGAYHIKNIPLNFPNESFDVIFLIEVVEHLNDKKLDLTLKEALRLLRKGGLLFITTPNKEDLSASKNFCPECGAVFHMWQHVRSWSKKTLTKQLNKYEFEEYKVKTLSFSANLKSFKGFYYMIIRICKIIIGKHVDFNLIGIYRKPQK